MRRYTQLDGGYDIVAQVQTSKVLLADKKKRWEADNMLNAMWG